MPVTVPWLLDPDPAAPFPPASTALREPDGLLAMGGDLSPPRLLAAYRAGAFPWSSPGEPLLWWSPDPRTVFTTGNFRFSRGNRRALRDCRHWTIAVDRDFAAVMSSCATIPRAGQHGTWIGPEMIQAYVRLHRLGHAHSFEVLDDGERVGGLYGVAVGRMFFAESMFSLRSGASKLALAAACRLLALQGFPLLDAQVHNPHLTLLGARPMERRQFLHNVTTLTALPDAPAPWSHWPVPAIRDLLA